MANKNLSTASAADIRALTYPIIFAKNPMEALDSVMRLIHENRMPGTAQQYVASISKALQSKTQLVELNPNPLGHSEEAIRHFLSELKRRLEEIFRL